MANLNGFKTQALVGNRFAFKFDEQPGIIERLKWNSDAAKKIGAVNRTGASVNILRPSRVTPTLTTLGVDYTLPNTTMPPVGFQQFSDPTVPLVVNVRAEVNLQVGIEELTLNRSKESIKQYIDEYVTIFRNKIESDLISKAINRVGQAQIQSSTITTGVSDYATNFFSMIGTARAQLIARGATTSNANDLTMLVNPFVQARVGAAGAKDFSLGSSLRQMQDGGKMVRNLAGWDMYESPLFSNIVLPIQFSGVTTTAAFGFDGAADLATNPAGSGYVETLPLALTGLVANVVIPAGAILQIAGIGNWINQDTGSDIGIACTVVNTATVQASADGVATLVVKEAPIITGPYTNVTISNQVASGATVTMLGADVSATTINPSLGFASSAFTPVSPKIVLPDDVRVIADMSFESGVNVVIVQSVWPGTIQATMKILGFYGIAVDRPEAAFVGYTL